MREEAGMLGFHGHVLVADLSRRSFEIRELDAGLLSGVLGGKGLGTALLAELAPQGVDPLAPENPVIFAVGPVTDTRIPGSCRYGLYAKSPLTGIYAESYSGGKLAEKISRTGFDAVVLTGASDTPVYVEVTEGGVRFHDARQLWGRDVYETERTLLDAYGGSKNAGAAVIGPAGERKVRFAIVANDLWRCAGRTGIGAVMGAKNVKAVVFRGNRSRPCADPDGINAFAKRITAERKDDPATQAYRNFGTPMMVALLNKVGGFPARYWHQGRKEHWEKISAEAMQDECAVRPKACPRCFMACGKLTEVTKGRHKGLRIEGPEYETIYAFGGLCLIDSIEEIAYLNDICDRLGLDTITGGNLVALAMEAKDRGTVPEAPSYGDVDGAARLLHDIAARRGLGEVLAEGVRHAAAEWGLEDLAVHVKGMEPAGYDPRALKGMALAYATSDRGACHLRATFYKPELSGQIPPDQVEGKAKLFVDYEDRLTFFDTLVLCRFFRDFYQWPELAEMVRLTTGLDVDEAAARTIARRVTDEVRRFNLREGLTKEDDWMPERIFDEPLPETGAAITRDELEKLRSDYYALRGWDQEGRPRGG